VKLGILVVYLVDEADEKLLDLHLRQIERNTLVSYQIYCTTNRLLPQFRAKLRQNSAVRFCECPTTDLRAAAEHSYYLDRLVEFAVEDGCSHLVTLHVDSFPTHPDWVERLDSKLGESVALATVAYGPYTSCLFFRREFYLLHQPRFLISEAERSSADYASFSRSVKHVLHSGAGYLFRAHLDGLTWSALTESNQDTAIGTRYDNMLFHLHGTARYGREQFGESQELTSTYAARYLERARSLVRANTPEKLRGSLWQHFGGFLERRIDQPLFEYSKKQFLENADSYFDAWRKSEK
jgi:hypothetical protein